MMMSLLLPPVLLMLCLLNDELDNNGGGSDLPRKVAEDSFFFLTIPYNNNHLRVGEMLVLDARTILSDLHRNLSDNYTIINLRLSRCVVHLVAENSECCLIRQLTPKMASHGTLARKLMNWDILNDVA